MRSLLALLTLFLCWQTPLPVHASQPSNWQLIAPEDVPTTGTFRSVQHPDWPPLPFNWLSDYDLSVYSTGNNQFVIDDSNVDYDAMREWVTAQNGESLMSAQGAYGAEESGMFGAESFSSDDLWLEIISKTNDVGTFVIHPPETELTNGVYDLFDTTNLVESVPGLNVTNWEWIVQTLPGQTNLVVSNLLYDIAFFRLGRTNDPDSDGMSTAFENLVSHSDPNNGDQNTNGIPDGWEWDYFGDFDQPADGDYDNDGIINIDEYYADSDPNTVTFGVDFESLRVNTDSANGTFTNYGGLPSKMAVLVDNTNLATATWMPYSPTVSVNLGSTDEKHEVWIGLKGRARFATPSWQGFELTRDTVPPAIVITNPVAATLSKPVIQLQGYSPEPLASLSYDLTNSNGVILTNELGGVTKQYFDTNLFECTTNWFVCTDIPLTNGVNTIILRATDEAGNISTNVFTYTLDFSGDTDAPNITLTWPPNGATVCGDSFVADGRVDDETAQFSVQIVNANGDTNSVDTLVQRDGKFRTQDLPLSSGTNYLTLVATDAANNSSVTNVTVVKGDLVLAMTGYSGDLWDPTVTVYGVISDDTQAVWVNGIQATVQTGGSWTATDVPVTQGGVASFTITAYAPGEPQP